MLTCNWTVPLRYPAKVEELISPKPLLVVGDLTLENNNAEIGRGEGDRLKVGMIVQQKEVVDLMV